MESEGEVVDTQEHRFIAVHQLDKVKVAAATVFKQGYFIFGLSSRVTLLTQVGKVGEHVGFTDHTAGQRNRQFADVMDRGFACVNEQAAALKGLVIGFTHIGGIGADQIDMGTRSKPLAANDRLLASDGRTDQVCAAGTCLDIGYGREADMRKFFGKSGAQIFGLVRGPIPYLHPF